MDYKIKFLKNITEKDLPVLLAIWCLIIKEPVFMTPSASFKAFFSIEDKSIFYI
ncbi:hypothetical protein [Wolbachia endosymbiont of Trichogramma kaykai]|uniref:hypothetical protein n=1 Tax=Wolbachia endosymbiont of Trichogramma kaykai TaxID=444066 RepID=UPI0038919031